MKTRPGARHAYVHAEVVTALAHQIRILRQQRGWTQRELAKRLGTTQAAVSRLEDPSYGRASLQTLIDLAQAFDTGLQVRFLSTVQMLSETWRPRHAALQVRPFSEEAEEVCFYTSSDSARSSVTVQPALNTFNAVRVDVAQHGSLQVDYIRAINVNNASAWRKTIAVDLVTRTPTAETPHA